jgi:hypothetical protein
MNDRMEQFDPNGIDQHSAGAKVDAGKCEFGLIQRGFANALLGVADVGTYGACKYTRDGWKEVPEGVRRYLDAMYRHLNAYHRGEGNDPESGISHIDHAAWNILAVSELIKRGDV